MEQNTETQDQTHHAAALPSLYFLSSVCDVIHHIGVTVHYIRTLFLESNFNAITNKEIFGFLHVNEWVCKPNDTKPEKKQK